MAKLGTKIIKKAIKRQLKKTLTKGHRKMTSSFPELDPVQVAITGYEQQIKVLEGQLAHQLKKLKHYTHQKNKSRKTYKDQDVEGLINFTEGFVKDRKEVLAQTRKTLSALIYEKKHFDNLKESFKAINDAPEESSFTERKDLFKAFIDSHDLIRNMQHNKNYDPAVSVSAQESLTNFLGPDPVNAQLTYLEIKQAHDSVANLEQAVIQLSEIERQARPDREFIHQKLAAYHAYLEAFQAVNDIKEDNPWVDKLIGKVKLVDEEKYNEIEAKNNSLEKLEWDAFLLNEQIGVRLEQLENQKQFYQSIISHASDLDFSISPMAFKKFTYLENNINKLKQLNPEKIFLQNQENPKKIQAMRLLFQAYDFRIEMGLDAFKRAEVLQRNINRTQDAVRVFLQHHQFEKLKNPLEELLVNLELTKFNMGDEFASGDQRLLGINRRLDEINRQQAGNIGDYKVVSWLEKNADNTLNHLQSLIMREQRAIKDYADDAGLSGSKRLDYLNQYHSSDIQKYQDDINTLKDYQPDSLEKANQMKNNIMQLNQKVAERLLENNVLRLERITRSISLDNIDGSKYLDHFLMICNSDSPTLLPNYQSLFRQVGEDFLSKRNDLDILVKRVHSEMRESRALAHKTEETKALKESLLGTARLSEEGYQSFANSLSLFKPKESHPDRKGLSNSKHHVNRANPPKKSK